MLVICSLEGLITNQILEREFVKELRLLSYILCLRRQVLWHLLDSQR